MPKANWWYYPDYDHDANVSRYQNDSNAPFPSYTLHFLLRRTRVGMPAIRAAVL